MVMDVGLEEAEAAAAAVRRALMVSISVSNAFRILWN